MKAQETWDELISWGEGVDWDTAEAHHFGKISESMQVHLRAQVKTGHLAQLVFQGPGFNPTFLTHTKCLLSPQLAIWNEAFYF